MTWVGGILFQNLFNNPCLIFLSKGFWFGFLFVVVPDTTLTSVCKSCLK